MCLCTCGLYPYCFSWIKLKIDYKNMALKRQIIFGTLVTAMITLLFLIAVLVFNMQLFFNSTGNQLKKELLAHYNRNII